MSANKLSVIIPAYNEAPYLNRTVNNIYDTASGDVEVVVVNQGGNGPIDERCVVVEPAHGNVGERVAMNMAAARASGTHLFRIDAHCDFSPVGWDEMLCGVTGPTDLTMAVLTAIRKPWDATSQEEKDEWLAKGKSRVEWSDWTRLPGHWYGFTRFVCSNDDDALEAKWQKPNHAHDHYHGVHPTMAATGCAMCLTADFYDKIGGADVSLPPMGAIGEEFAIKAWHYGGCCQVHTDVMVGHIFGTGGYATDPVIEARQKLWQQYSETYHQVVALPQFADFTPLRIVKATQPGPPARTVTVTRIDTTDTSDDTGKLLRRKVETFKYIWLSAEHQDELQLTDKQIEKKYAAEAVKISEKIIYADNDGDLLDVTEPNLIHI